MENSSNKKTTGLRREMGMFGILFAAVGSIIGSGWLFGALEASEIAGPGSIFSWVIGGILMIFVALCYAELGTMFPVSGGVIRYPHFSFGSFNSYTLGWLTWMSAASTTAIEVLAAMQYANSYLPDWFQVQHLVNGSAVLTTLGYSVAIVLLAIFTLVNFFGIRWFMRLNNTLVWWKIGVIILVIGTFMFTTFNLIHFHNVEAGGFFPKGAGGVFSAVATAGIVFSFLGFRQGIELAGETKNPSRNVPIAVIGSILLTLIIYVLLQVAFIGVLPLDALKDGWQNIGTSLKNGDIPAQYGPLAALAGSLGLGFLVIILYADAFISPADTALIYTTVTSRLSYAMGKNKNAPETLAKVNSKGVPWVSVIVTFIAGSVFFFAFPGWEKLVGFVTTCTILSFGSGPLVLLAMRKQLPDHKRPFKLPMVKLLAFLGFLATNMIAYWSGWTTLKPIAIAVVIGYIIYIAHEIINKDKTPPIEFKAGYWVLVWIIGLSVISYLGSYPNVSKHAGNTGLIPVGWGLPILAVFALLIMWLANANRLSTEQVKKHLDDPALQEDMGEEL